VIIRFRWSTFPIRGRVYSQSKHLCRERLRCIGSRKQQKNHSYSWYLWTVCIEFPSFYIFCIHWCFFISQSRVIR